MQIYCKIDNGKFPDYAISQLKQAVSGMHNKKITIKVTKETRSNKQNNYYWGVIIPAIKKVMNELIKQAGHPEASDDDIHLFLLGQIGRLVRIPTKSGELVIKRGISMTDKQECEECFEAIRAFAAERGIIIPLPNENQFYNGDYND
jgi:hypothetical protein